MFKSSSKSSVGLLQVHRLPTYKSYHQDKLSCAYEEVMHHHMSIRQAADQYGVPRATLADRVSGRVKIWSS